MELFKSDWPAWIALAAAVLSPVATILIDKVYQVAMAAMSRSDARKSAMALLIADIAKASSHPAGSPPELSTEAAKALVHCNPETCAAVLRYFSAWPETGHAIYSSESPIYVFPKLDGGYQHDTIQSASEKLIQSIRYESEHKRGTK